MTLQCMHCILDMIIHRVRMFKMFKCLKKLQISTVSREISVHIKEYTAAQSKLISEKKLTFYAFGVMR